MSDDDIQGTVTDEDGNPVEGATISTFEHGENDVAHTTTDANGEYLFDYNDIAGQGPWHVLARYSDGGGNYSAYSNPYVEAVLGNLDITIDGTSNVDSTSVDLTGAVDDMTALDAVDAYFEYRETGTSSWTPTTPATQNATGSYSETVTGLTEETEYEARAVADNTSPSGFSDISNTVTWTTEPAIPDSEADQKLVHRWYLSEDSGAFIDQIGSADGTNNGTTQVTGDWIDDAARQGDGTDDYIETTPWGSFGGEMDTDFALAASIETTASSGRILGRSNSDDSQLLMLTVGENGPNGAIELFLRDVDGDAEAVYTDATFNDGNPHRVLINKFGNSASDIDIWVDGNNEPTTVDRSQGFSSPSNFDGPVFFHAINPTGSLNGVVDDPCVFGDSLASAEAQSYDAPWS